MLLKNDDAIRPSASYLFPIDLNRAFRLRIKACHRFRTVDFPQPEGPSRETNSPFFIVNVISSSA